MIDKTSWKNPQRINSGSLLIESGDGRYKLWFDGRYTFYWQLGTAFYNSRSIETLYDLDSLLCELNIGYSFGELNNRLKEVGLRLPLNKNDELVAV